MKRNWTPKKLLSHAHCGHGSGELTVNEAVCFECGEIRAGLYALAGVAHPEKLPELLRQLGERFKEASLSPELEETFAAIGYEPPATRWTWPGRDSNICEEHKMPEMQSHSGETWRPAIPEPYPPTFLQRLACFFGKRCFGARTPGGCDCKRGPNSAAPDDWRRLVPGMHYADLIIRHNGQDYHYDFTEQLRKVARARLKHL